ncbi:MAG: addiction module antitoxin [Synergistaceae bacterium]|nr:addiction module antitoxin [Synergistaceae bacterium]
MQRKLTITLDEEVYDGLWRRIGKRRISNYIETLIRPHVIDSSLDEAYKAMAADIDRETEAIQWCNALAGDMTDEAR